MNNQLELPAEVVSEYYDNDCVRVVVAPPAGVQSPDWASWAHKAFPLPVLSVERLAEGSRLLLAVTLGEETGREPRTFRLAPPVSHRRDKALPIVTVNLNGVSGWTPPPPARPPAQRDVCERPVRVKSSTHAKIQALSKHLGLSISATIDAAVSAMIDG